MSNYERKYYLIRKIKAAGFELEKSNNERIVLVRGDQVKEAKENKYLLELVDEFGYGIQPVLSTRMPKCEIAHIGGFIGHAPLFNAYSDPVCIGHKAMLNLPPQISYGIGPSPGWGNGIFTNGTERFPGVDDRLRKSMLSRAKRPSLFKRIVKYFLPKVKEHSNL